MSQLHCYTAVQQWHDIYSCLRRCSLSVRWIKMREHCYKRGPVSHYCVIDWWQWLHVLRRWAMTHKLSHLSFALYLNRNVQRIHNLPDHEWQEVDSQQHSNCCVEFPWLQVLLCEFEQRHTHTHTQAHTIVISIQGHHELVHKQRQTTGTNNTTGVLVISAWLGANCLSECVSSSVCVRLQVYFRSSGSLLVWVCVCVCVRACVCVCVFVRLQATHRELLYLCCHLKSSFTHTEMTLPLCGRFPEAADINFIVLNLSHNGSNTAVTEKQATEMSSPTELPLALFFHTHFSVFLFDHALSQNLRRSSGHSSVE